MGKLKFTISNIWFWTALMGITILAENLQFLTSSYMVSGFNVASVFILSAIAIISLFMFFFISHKENKMRIDFVLLPVCILIMIMLVVGIWSQGTMTIPYESIEGSVEASVTTFEKVKATIVALTLVPFIYAMTYTLHRQSPNSKAGCVALYVGVIFVYIAIIMSFVLDRDSYLAILADKVDKSTVSNKSFFGNKNEYGFVVLCGILVCMLINYHRPRFFWYMTIIFFLWALITTAAMMSIIIGIVSVPLYMLLSIVRNSIKKKWHLVVFATIATLTALALCLIFYIGVMNHWNGFVGVDEYFTEVIYKKDFKTLTGRTVIWQHLFPYCFDNPIHMVVGHGMMLSEKYIYAITTSFWPEGGVRSAHNGYIQLLFEFGLVGLVVNFILVAMFFYSLIRLLLEKRFYFVLVYGLVALSLAVYNIGESSPLFYYGVKECYLTVVVAAPVIARAKLLGRKEVVQEAMDLPLKSMGGDPIKIGKGLSVVIVSFMMAMVPLFFCQFTYSNNVIMPLVLIFGGLLLLLLFVPYLVSLYYRCEDKSMFVLHCVGNFLGLALVLFATLFPLLALGHRRFAVGFSVFMCFIYLCFDVVIYSFIKHGSFKQWFQVTLVGGFAHPASGIAATLIFGSLMYLVIQGNGAMNWFTYLFGMVVNLELFYMFYHFIPVLKGKEVIYEYNNISLYSIKRCTIKDETTYG